MRITRWNPFRELEEFQRTVDQMLGRAQQRRESYGYPPIDLMDRGDAFVLSAFLPGIRADQINLSVMERTVQLAGGRQPPVIEGAKPLLRERLYGQFHRSIELPEPVREEEVNAQYLNGILRVILPKRRALSPRIILVE